MRKIRNIVKRMSVFTIAAALVMTSVPVTALAAETEAAAGDAEAYLAGVSGPDVADYAEAQDDILSSGDLTGNEDESGDKDVVAGEPEEASDEIISGEDSAVQDEIPSDAELTIDDEADEDY